ncbi:cytochrome P450 [Streptomyces sp. SID12488]|uniref:cytochrome P450 n=1 Tax=Streptomyces sp. SID12488 TaxID=2706040 RepID=UPI0013D90FFF|nr:cytochrome P450 [Streptomyces sp. SID12488]
MRITKPTAADRVPLDRIDLYDPRVFSNGDPHAIWRTLRHEEPVFWQDLPDGRGFWSVTKYDDVCRVLSDHTVFTSARGGLLTILGTDDPAGGHQMAVSDPPRHTHVRKPLHQMMTPAALKKHIPRIEVGIKRLLAPMTEEPVWDLGAAMTALPMVVSGILMGLPEEDHAQLVRSGMMTIAADDHEFQQGGTPEATLQQAHHDLFAYFARQVRARRTNPGPGLGDSDLIGRLMTMEVDGSRLTNGEIVANCYSVLLGANVNTGHVISSAFLELMDHPGEFERWAGDPQYLRTGIREAMRWSSPVVHFLRYAVQDTEIRGRRIRKGEGVAAWIPSANRDEEVFDDPFRFDIDRRPNREISLGFGPHRCIGGTAAQISLEIALREIFDRVSYLEPVGKPEHLCSNFTAGIKHFPVTVHKR